MLLPINALGKSMSTKGTKHFPTFYLQFTYKYQQCVEVEWQLKCYQFSHHFAVPQKRQDQKMPLVLSNTLYLKALM